MFFWQNELQRSEVFFFKQTLIAYIIPLVFCTSRMLHLLSVIEDECKEDPSASTNIFHIPLIMYNRCHRPTLSAFYFIQSGRFHSWSHGFSGGVSTCGLAYSMGMAWSPHRPTFSMALRNR